MSQTEAKYLIRRFYCDEGHPDHRKVIDRDLTLAEAREHCQRPETHGTDGEGLTVWFDGFEETS